MQDTPDTLRNRPERNTQPRASVIYLIRNRLNGKSYVGQTVKTLQARWAEHIRDARKGSPFLFHRAIRKYGVEVFSESLLATAADRQELDALEISWITKLDTMSPAGYNTKLGKQGHPTEDVRQRISMTLKGRPKSAEHCKNISAGQKKRSRGPTGKKRSPEAVEKTRIALKGRSLSLEHRKKLSDALKGRKCSPESVAKRTGIKASEKTRAKLRAARSTRVFTAATREKMSRAQRGKKRSASTIAKWRHSRSGYSPSAETRARIGAALKGHKMPEAHRLRLIAHNTGRVVSDETRVRMRESHLGRKSSEAAIAKMKVTWDNKRKGRVREGND